MSVLSPRNIDILRLVARGQTNIQIAHTLSISEQTVKNHLSDMYRILRANDRTQAVLIAVRRGYIEIEAPAPPLRGMDDALTRLEAVREELATVAAEVDRAIVGVRAIRDAQS